MEALKLCLWMLIRLWMSYVDSLHRWKMFGKQEQTHIQSEAGLSSHIWRKFGFVHSIHSPYYYY